MLLKSIKHSPQCNIKAAFKIDYKHVQDRKSFNFNSIGSFRPGGQVGWTTANLSETTIAEAFHGTRK